MKPSRNEGLSGPVYVPARIIALGASGTILRGLIDGFFELIASRTRRHDGTVRKVSTRLCRDAER